MEFEPIYHGDRLTIINPGGDVGLVTLWTKVDAALSVFGGAGIDLNPETSRVAVAANLYGNGLPHMLRNLLHNPQIRHLVVCGKNLSGSREWLVNFFERGIEKTVLLGNPAFRIVGTDRFIDGEVLPEHFAARPDIATFGDISAEETKVGIKSHLESLPVSPDASNLARVDPPGIPEPVITRLPSNPATHMVHRRTAIEAYREIVFRLYKFGHRTTVMKSSGPEERVELLSMHVTVEDTRDEAEEALAELGFSLSKFRAYQERILDPVRPEGLQYTYGWLLRTGVTEATFKGGAAPEGEAPVDSLMIVAERLKKDPDSRHAYVALWNNRVHLPSGKGCPCFVTAFFRRFEGKLTMTATFRAHNAMDGWLENFYGLAAIQRFVAEKAQIETGPIIVISHSISLDPAVLDRAKRVADGRASDDDVDPATGKHELRLDPNGAFTVTYDRNTWELVVEHTYQGMKVGEYRGKTAEQVEAQLNRDLVVSLVSHAMYLGRELARKEAEMKAQKSKVS